MRSAAYHFNLSINDQATWQSEEDLVDAGAFRYAQRHSLPLGVWDKPSIAERFDAMFARWEIERQERLAKMQQTSPCNSQRENQQSDS